jgi:hypothetical protein
MVGKGSGQITSLKLATVTPPGYSIIAGHGTKPGFPQSLLLILGQIGGASDQHGLTAHRHVVGGHHHLEPVGR